MGSCLKPIVFVCAWLSLSSACVLCPVNLVVDPRFDCQAVLEVPTFCSIVSVNRVLADAPSEVAVKDVLRLAAGIPNSCARMLAPAISSGAVLSIMRRMQPITDNSLSHDVFSQVLEDAAAREQDAVAYAFNTSEAYALMDGVRSHLKQLGGGNAGNFFTGTLDDVTSARFELQLPHSRAAVLAPLVPLLLNANTEEARLAASIACDALLRASVYRYQRHAATALLLNCAQAYMAVRRSVDALDAARTSVAVAAGSAAGSVSSNSENRRRGGGPLLQGGVYEARVFLAWMREEVHGDKLAAEAQGLAALSADPSHCVAPINLGWIYLDSGMLRQAQDALAQLFARTGGHDAALSNFGTDTEVAALTRVGPCRCKGVYGDKTYWNMAQAHLEQRSLSAVLEGRRWLRRSACASLQQQVAELKIRLVRPLAGADTAAVMTLAQACVLIVAALDWEPPPGGSLARVVTANRSAALGFVFGEGGSFGLSLHRTDVSRGLLSPSLPAAFARIASLHPGFGWSLLLSCTLTPQIMPHDSADIRAWRQSTLHAMQVLQWLSSTSAPLSVGADGESDAANSRPDDGCVRLAAAGQGVPEMPFAWHYHGHDDDRELQEVFAALLACNYAGYVSPLLLAAKEQLMLSRLSPSPRYALPERVAQLQAWKQRQHLLPADAARNSSGTGGCAARGRSVFPFDSPLRVGFVSKYFTLNHPHSQLFTGVVRRLDRARVVPVLLRIRNVDRGYFLDPEIEEAVLGGAAAAPNASHGVAITVPNDVMAAQALLASLGLDALVYADHLSEHTSAALGFARLAPVQAQYWGNPVTTGKGAMDYFVSGEFLESDPTALVTSGGTCSSSSFEAIRRAALKAAGCSAARHVSVSARGVSPFYSERVARLPGTGIHYERIAAPAPEFLCRCGRYDPRLPEPPGCPLPHALMSAEGRGVATDAGRDVYTQREPLMRHVDALRPACTQRPLVRPADPAHPPATPAVAAPNSTALGTGAFRITSGTVSLPQHLIAPAAAAMRDERPIVFGCPQSLYKMRAEFDAVLAAILRAVPSALLVMVTERRELHTRQYRARLERTMAHPACLSTQRLPDYAAGAPDCSDPASVAEEARRAVLSRIVWVPRQSGSDAYFGLLSCVDVLLHPFPFDGSKTAADGVALALPMVTLPTNNLRGRMGAALYRQLGLDGREGSTFPAGDGREEEVNLVAADAADYVRIAVRLAMDAAFRAAAVLKLRTRRHAVFAWPSAATTTADGPQPAADSSDGGGSGGPEAIVEGWHEFLVGAVAEATEAYAAAAAESAPVTAATESVSDRA